MKKKSIIIIMSAVIVLSAILSACAFMDAAEKPSGSDTLQDQPTDSTDTKIKDLEAKITALMQSHQLSESERQKEIAALKSELENLKKEKEENEKQEDKDEHTDKNDGSGQVQDTQKEESQIFKYSLSSGVITITAILSEEENLIIPSSIDGYRVYAIGSEALSSSKVKSITVSPGIEKLDWFAFKNCPALSSVSIPDSVSSIGYGAFDNSSAALVIRCSRDSFAHRYAQSYGLTYDIT